MLNISLNQQFTGIVKVTQRQTSHEQNILLALMRCGISSPEGPEIDVTVPSIRKLQQVMWVSGVVQHIDF